MAKLSNATVIGIMESKLDNCILDSEIELDNYQILRCDRNRKGRGVTCYVRNDIISTSLINHILASLPERISQEDVINVGLSDHQLIYCTRKISKIKTGGVHKKNQIPLT